MYEKIKTALSERRSDISYFDKDFFDMYMKERHEVFEHAADGIRQAEYVNTRKSDFYSKNGGAYCEFLSVVSAMCDKVYEVEYYKKGCLYTKNKDRAAFCGKI